MIIEKVPSARLAFIGGSSTYSVDFEDFLDDNNFSVLEKELVIETPYGQSPPFILFFFENNQGQKIKALACKMHGWRKGTSRADASRQLFWVFHQAGVEKVISEGGTGTLNPDFKPGDLIIPDDFIDFSERRSLSIVGRFLLQMKDPICPTLSALLFETAKDKKKVHKAGVYIVTEGIRFETKAEISMMKKWGADVVGQSLSPEVYLSREIGACFCGLYLITNQAEGLGKAPMHDQLKELFYGEAESIAEILAKAFKKITFGIKCSCLDYRHQTLLRPKNQNEYK